MSEISDPSMPCPFCPDHQLWGCVACGGRGRIPETFADHPAQVVSQEGHWYAVIGNSQVGGPWDGESGRRDAYMRADYVNSALTAYREMSASRRSLSNARHEYVSTACAHDKHGSCRGTCKFCDSGCSCGCHETECCDTVRVPDTLEVVRCDQPRGHEGGAHSRGAMRWTNDFPGRLGHR